MCCVVLLDAGDVCGGVVLLAMCIVACCKEEDCGVCSACCVMLLAVCGVFGVVLFTMCVVVCC